MKKIILNRYLLAVFAAMIFVGLTSSNIHAQVKGPNVTKVEVGNSGVEGRLVQTGPKTWTSYQTNGGQSETFTETGRDEWSVYLTSPNVSSAIINLFQKTLVIKQGSTVVYSTKILSSSADPINTAPATNSGTSLEQQCFNAVQGKIAYDQAGNKTWGASNVQKLCAGTTNPAATIACFQAEIKSHNSWSRGIEACRAGGTTPRANVTTTTTPTTATPTVGIEQQCFNAIQGKVAYDQAGNTRWGSSNVQKLCAGTTNVAATIACFQAEIKSHNSWSRGIEACKTNPTVARAAAVNTNTSAISATRSAAAETSRPSPLSVNQMAHVMQWIAVKTSAARLPFCWRKSEGRGVGTIPLCPPGYAKDPGSLICTTPCKPDEQYFDGICYPRNCPAGFRNDGLYCGKPAAYTRESFPWKPGDPLLPNYSGPTGRCEAKYGKGQCERGGALIFPKCKASFNPVASGSVCSPICPSGYADIGVSCKKPTSKRGVVYANTCPPGTVKDATGDLCYPACGAGDTPGFQKEYSGAGPKGNYKGVGPVCWQNCPSQQSVDCGAGCATTKLECAKSVISMTTAPIIAAVKIAALVATFGGSSAATGSAGAAVGGGKLIANSPKLIKLAQLADKLQRFAKTYKDTIKAATTTKTVVLALKSEIELFATEFASNFGEMTSPEIEKMIDEKFSKEAALEIKKEWGRHHAGLMLEANAINTTYNVLSVAGIADPTGLVGVVSAFTNPLCKDDTPFPNVNPKY
ncbi:MAG: hypothetical protein R2681_17640 [Pyrinomonadaceae bacterium]